ncbi:hypothetical protein BJV82DRAFT_661282 [Fennellomyces sp. T-0311]|nr:hypothetical protein BJV82DRAFT_661282 [Fennellomyces sp. T-0311]
MSSDDEDDELRDFQNGDSSSDGDSDSISCDDDDDDSVRLHGDGRTLRTPGLLETRGTDIYFTSAKSASITEAQNYSQGIGAIEVNDDTSLDGGSKKLGSQKSPKLLRTQTTITHPKKRRGRPPKKVTKDADEETTLKGKNCKEAQVYEGVGMKGSKHDMMG